MISVIECEKTKYFKSLGNFSRTIGSELPCLIYVSYLFFVLIKLVIYNDLDITIYLMKLYYLPMLSLFFFF